MNVDVRVDRKLDHATIVLSGSFDLAHSSEVVHAVRSADAHLDGCQSADVSLAQVNRIDGSGAVLLARLLDRLAAKRVSDRRRRRREPRGVETTDAISAASNRPPLSSATYQRVELRCGEAVRASTHMSLCCRNWVAASEWWPNHQRSRTRGRCRGRKYC